MTTPVQNLTQELKHTAHINRINDLTLQTNADFLNITIEHEDDIDATELDGFRTSMANIERRTSAILMDLCTGRHPTPMTSSTYPLWPDSKVV